MTKIALKPTLLAIAIFLFATAVSYSSTFGHLTFITFQLGYPFEFFLKGWECGAESPEIIWTIQNLFYDLLISFMLAINCYFAIGWKKKPANLFLTPDIAGWLFFVAWFSLSCLAGLLLIHDLQETHGKGFSRTGFLNYGFLFMWLIGILGTMRTIFKSSRTSNKKHSS